MKHLCGVEEACQSCVFGSQQRTQEGNTRAKGRTKGSKLSLQCRVVTAAGALRAHVRGDKIQEKVRPVIMVFQHPRFFL